MHAAALGIVAALTVLTRHYERSLPLTCPAVASDAWRQGAAGSRSSGRGAARCWRWLQCGGCGGARSSCLQATTDRWREHPTPTRSDSRSCRRTCSGVLARSEALLLVAVLLFAVAACSSLAAGPGRCCAVSRLLALNAWLVASWMEWQYGPLRSSGVHRHPGVLAVFLAAFFAWTSEHPRLLPWVAGAATLATALSVVQMIQYWLRVWPVRDITWAQYRSLFLTFP